jgi:4-amino-4-deoxy-L-arabinose transferase-like glycosyltransferase
MKGLTFAGRIPYFDLGIVALAVLIGFVILFVFGEAGRVMQTGDAPLYVRLATNLIRYGVLSGSFGPPIEPSLYRLPGYPVFLTIFFWMFGGSHLAVKIIQFVLFGLIAVLIRHGVLMRTKDDRTAKLASVLVVVHLPLIFFIPLIQTEALTTFLAVLAMVVLQYCKDTPPRVFRFLSVGILVGMLSMVRPSFSLLVIPVIILLALEKSFLGPSKDWKRRLFASSMVIVGFSLLMGPWLARNYVISGRLLLSSAGSESFYWSIRQYKGETNYNLWQQWETQYFPSLKAKEIVADEEIRNSIDAGTLSAPASVTRELSIDSQWRADAKAEMADLTVWQVISRIPRRVLALWAPSYIHAPSWLYVPVIQRTPEVQIWLMIGGALFGLWARRRELVREWPLWIVPIYLTAIHMIFHLETRYSIPGHPFLLIFAAVGMMWILDKIGILDRFSQRSSVEIASAE